MLYINSTAMEHESDPSYKIPVNNVTFSNVSNDFTTGFNLTGEWNVINTTTVPDSNTTTYYWINTPYSIFSGVYSGTISIEGVEYGTAP